VIYRASCHRVATEFQPAPRPRVTQSQRLSGIYDCILSRRFAHCPDRNNPLDLAVLTGNVTKNAAQQVLVQQVDILF